MQQFLELSEIIFTGGRQGQLSWFARLAKQLLHAAEKVFMGLEQGRARLQVRLFFEQPAGVVQDEMVIFPGLGALLFIVCAYLPLQIVLP